MCDHEKNPGAPDSQRRFVEKHENRARCLIALESLPPFNAKVEFIGAGIVSFSSLANQNRGMWDTLYFSSPRFAPGEGKQAERSE